MLIIDLNLLRAVTRYDASGRPRAGHTGVSRKARRRLPKPDTYGWARFAIRATTVTGTVKRIAYVCHRVVTAKRAER